MGDEARLDIPERHHQATLLLHGKLTARSSLIAIFFTPVSVIYLLVQITGKDSQSAAHSSLQTMAATLPYASIVLIAAVLPEGVPRRLSLTSSGHMALLMCVMMVSDIVHAYDTLASFVEYPAHIRIIRALVSATNALCYALMALDTLRHRAKRWWASCRVTITACSSVRLGAVLTLRALGAHATCYPPGHSSFGFALLFSILCVASGTIGLAPPWRRRLSEWTGLSRVTLTLAELPHLPGGQREARGAERREALSDSGSEPGRSRLHRKPFHHHSSSSSSNHHRSKSVRSGDSSRSNLSPQSGEGGGGRVAPLPFGSRSSAVLVTAGAGEVGNDGRIVHAHHFSANVGNGKRRWQTRRITMYPEDFARLRAQQEQAGAGGDWMVDRPRLRERGGGTPPPLPRSRS